MKAFEAFVNNDTDSAKDYYRKFFIESAQEINSQLEEEFGGDMEEDLYDETEVDMEDGMDDEGEDFADEFAEFEDEDGEDEMEDDVEGDNFADEDDVEVPVESWENFEDAFEELEALFNDASSNEMEEDEEMVEESFDYQGVKDPGMKSETGADASSSKSTVAKPQMKGPTGAKASDGWSKDGTVKGSNVKADYPDSEKAKDEGRSNVMANSKNAYTKQSVPSMKETGADNKQSITKPFKK